MSKFIKKKFTFYSVSGNKYKCNQRKDLGPLNRRQMLELIKGTLDSGQAQIIRVSNNGNKPRKNKN